MKTLRLFMSIFLSVMVFLLSFTTVSYSAKPPTSYTIVSSSNSGGTIIPKGKIVVPVGGSRAFTITPDSAYYITDVRVDNVSVGSVTSYTFNNVSAKHTIKASFKIKTYTVTSSAGENGKISPAGTFTVKYGSSKSFTAIPSKGYKAAIKVDGEVVIKETLYSKSVKYKLSTITASHTVEGVFFTSDVSIYTNEWEQFFEAKVGKWEEFVPVALAIDSSDNVISAGNVTDTWGRVIIDSYILKYRGNNGSILWQQSLSDRAVVDLAIDSSNNVVVTGSSTSGANTYCFTAKYNGVGGSMLWERSFAGSKPALDIDSQNNIIVTATSGDNYYTVKYGGTDGVVLWEVSYDGGVSASPSDVAVDPSGDIIVTGITEDIVNWPWATYYYHTIKYRGTDGVNLWQQSKVRDYYSSQPLLSVDSMGNIILVLEPNGDGNYFTIKYSGVNGSLVWERGFDGNARVVLADSADNVIVAGSPNYHTVKYSAVDGNIIWENFFENDGNPTAIAIDSRNDIIITGNPGYTVKYQSSDGTIVWRKCYYYNAGALNVFRGQITDVAVDSSNDVLVIASDTIQSIKGSDTFDDVITIKYIGNAPLAPIVRTNPATDFIYRHSSHGHARLNGAVTPNGDITKVWFEYGTNTSYGITTTPQDIGNKWESIEIMENITVQYNTTYHFRAVASNIEGTVYGEDRSFATPKRPRGY